MAQHLRRIVPSKDTVDFEDFRSADGQLLPVSVLRSETYERWAARRREVDALLICRAALYREVATHTIVVPVAQLPTTVQIALSDRITAQWRGRIRRQIARSGSTVRNSGGARPGRKGYIGPAKPWRKSSAASPTFSSSIGSWQT